MWQASHSRLDFRRPDFSPSLRTVRRTEFVRCQTKDWIMQSVRAIATLLSVVAIASSAFAASWVGLALLGY
jgi:hypothetical protein